MFKNIDDGDLWCRVDVRESFVVGGICGLIEVGPAGELGTR